MNEYYKIIAWSDCPFCVKAKDLLVKNNKQFMFCCIDESTELHSYIREKYQWHTVPLIVRVWNTSPVAGDYQWEEEFIGGYSDLLQLFSDTGE